MLLDRLLIHDQSNSLKLRDNRNTPQVNAESDTSIKLLLHKDNTCCVVLNQIFQTKEKLRYNYIRIIHLKI